MFAISRKISIDISSKEIIVGRQLCQHRGISNAYFIHSSRVSNQEAASQGQQKILGRGKSIIEGRSHEIGLSLKLE